MTGFEFVESKFRVPEGMVQFCRDLPKSDPGLEQTNRGGYHSSFDAFKRDMPGVDVLLKAIRDTLTRHGEALSEQLKICGWVNVHPLGGHNVRHAHNGVRCVALAYLTTGSPIILHTESGSLKIAPEPGKLLLLRDTLEHEVLPNDNDDRINIACNIYPAESRDPFRKFCVQLPDSMHDAQVAESGKRKKKNRR